MEMQLIELQLSALKIMQKIRVRPVRKSNPVRSTPDVDLLILGSFSSSAAFYIPLHLFIQLQVSQSFKIYYCSENHHLEYRVKGAYEELKSISVFGILTFMEPTLLLSSINFCLT